MASFEHAGVRLAYADQGSGFPLFALAPGGLRSTAAAWQNRPIEPARDFGNEYRLITMDQRNAGQSWAPITGKDAWHSYTQDQVALLDHLGVERFHVMGMCIGGAFILSLLKAIPERVASAVLIQPIGLENNRQVFLDLGSSWRDENRARHPEATDADYQAFFQNMFGGQFVFSASPADVEHCEVPMLVLLGDDPYHPAQISRQVAELAPAGSLIENWKEDPARTQAIEQLRAFFQKHTPV